MCIGIVGVHHGDCGEYRDSLRTIRQTVMKLGDSLSTTRETVMSIGIL